jgi:tetratricopeptide (TPR) repeat protein/Mg-chelatase subunit ChlD
MTTPTLPVSPEVPPARASSHKTTVLVASLAALAVIAAAIAYFVTREPPPERAGTLDARLLLVAGDVSLKEGDSRATVVSGVPLPSGAELVTGKGARALVRLSDGSSLLLRGDSDVALGGAGVSIAAGEVWLDAPPTDRRALVHHVGDVTISAVDAGLSIRRAEGEVSAVVTRGLAIVQSPAGRVEVHAGERAFVAGGAAPRVEAVAYWDDWTGGMGDRRPFGDDGTGAGRLYGVDPSGAPGASARPLEISKQSVRAVIRDGLAETEVDQTFANPGGRLVEGWYWFTLPENAIVTSFALETNGALVEGEVIEKQEAAARYVAAMRTAQDPALLEWIDGKSYRARIYPVPASGTRRVVLRYLELLPTVGDKLRYAYPMGSADPVEIGEFSLLVDLGKDGKEMTIATLADAVVEDGGSRVTMRRSGYAPRADFQLEATLRKAGPPMRVARFSPGEDRADYVMVRYVPDVDWLALKEAPGDVVVVVDTSASADEASRQQKASIAEAVLRALSPDDHFALIAIDSAPAALYPKEGLAAAEPKDIAAALERLAEHASGGATDLGAVLDVALGRVHGREQPAVVYVGDGLPTSGEVRSAELVERLRRSLAESRARFFTIGVGSEANHPLLRELARVGGGLALRVDESERVTSEVMRLVSAVKTPTITDLTIDLGAGVDEPMTSATGKVTRGQEVVLLARTHHTLPDRVAVKGRVSGQDIAKQYEVELDRGLAASLVPRLWAYEKMQRLLGDAEAESTHRGKIVELGMEYGLVTPFTSVLALDSEAAYAQQGIRRRSSPLRGVRLSALDASRPGEERALVDRLSPTPASAMGCNSLERSEDKASAPPPVGVAPAAKSEPATESSPVEQGYAAATAAAEAPAPSPPSEPTAAFEEAAKTIDAPQAAAPRAGPAGNAASPAPAGASPARRTDSKRPDDAVRDGDGLMSGLGGLGVVGGGGGKRAMGADREERERAQAAPIARAPSRTSAPARPCSDVAKRPLAERLVLWWRRLRTAASVEEALARYESARATCEIPDFRAKSAFIELMIGSVKNEGGAEAMLAHFAGEPETQRYVAKAILRRARDGRVVAVVRRALFGERVRWAEIDNELYAMKTPDERLTRLRAVLREVPGDPEGDLRLVRLLVEAGQKDEALAMGRRMRDQGFLSPSVALSLGDVLAKTGFTDDATRVYSEIVEFDPDSGESRVKLGDAYLRQGWYPAAYRQYATLTELAPADPIGWMRLAAAAAGSSRSDEALRILRKVSSAEGTPGPSDPRLFARMLSAALMGRLLADPALPKDQSDGLTRKLKELQLLSSPSSLAIATWEDYDALVALVATEEGTGVPIGEPTFGPEVGLSALLLPSADAGRFRFGARWTADAPEGRDVTVTLAVIRWDGKAFQVRIEKKALAATAKEISLN